MAEREKTVKNLCILRTLCAVNPNYGMGLDTGDCAKAVKWLDDALALLKAQEPRVLLLYEYRSIADQPAEDRVPVWLQWRDKPGRWMIPERAYAGYGVYWCCWTDKPTGEQMRAVKWT